MIGYEKEEYENNLTSVEHIQSGKLYWMILDADYMEYLKRIDPHIPDHDYGPDHIKPFYVPSPEGWDMLCGGRQSLYTGQA